MRESWRPQPPLEVALASLGNAIKTAPRPAPCTPAPAPPQALPLNDRPVDLPTRRVRRAKELRQKFQDANKGYEASKAYNANTGIRLALLAKSNLKHTLQPLTLKMFTLLIWYYHPGRLFRRTWLSLADELAASRRTAYRAKRELISDDLIGVTDKGIFVPELELCLPEEDRIATLPTMRAPKLPFEGDLSSPEKYLHRVMEKANQPPDGEKE